MIRFRNRLIKYLVIVLAASAHPVVSLALPPPQSKKKPPAAPTPAPASPAAEKSVMTAPSLIKPRPEYQFPVGQTYVYGAEWRVFNAGTATLRMEKAGQENRIVANAAAAGTISLLYHVLDRLESFFDPASFCSHNTSRHIEEGFRRVESSITFDYPRGKAVLDHKNIKKKESKHEEHDIPS